jgi:hypothetical protein
MSLCVKCGKDHNEGTIRKDLKIQCTRAEMDSLQIYNNRITCAMQAMNPNAIPDNADPDKALLFIKGMIIAKGDAMFLVDSWWREILEKYELPENSNLDFRTGDFYVLVPKE